MKDFQARRDITTLGYVLKDIYKGEKLSAEDIAYYKAMFDYVMSKATE